MTWAQDAQSDAAAALVGTLCQERRLLNIVCQVAVPTNGKMMQWNTRHHPTVETRGLPELFVEANNLCALSISISSMQSLSG